MLKIYRQGRFDGACFLYSIANAVYALTSREISDKKWDEMIDHMPFPVDFLKNDGGTTRYDDKHTIYEFALSNALAIFNTRLKLELVNIKNSKDIKNHIDKQSVVIFATKGGPTKYQKDIGSHWVVGVACDTQNINIACSWVWFARDSDYSEDRDQETKRYYNDLFPQTGKIDKSLVYKIQLNKD